MIFRVLLLSLLFVPSAWATQQITFGGSGGSASLNDTYTSPIGNNPLQTNGDETRRECLVTAAGTFSDLRVEISADLVSSEAIQFTVRKNGENTATDLIRCTITDIGGTETTCQASEADAFAAGDFIAIHSDETVGNPSVSYSASLIFTPTNPGDAVYCQNSSGGTLATTGTDFFNPAGLTTASATDTDRQTIVPGPGTLSNLWIDLLVAPGSGDTRTFDLMVNAAPSYSGFATTGVQVVISGSSETNDNDLTNVIHVDEGDLFVLRDVVTGGTAAASRFRSGITFTADTKGHFPLFGASGDQTNNAATEFSVPNGALLIWNASEEFSTDAGQAGTGDSSVEFVSIFVLMDSNAGAAASGDAWDYTLREDEGDTSLTCQVFEDERICDGHSIVAVDNDTMWGTKLVPTSSPTESTVAISYMARAKAKNRSHIQ